MARQVQPLLAAVPSVRRALRGGALPLEVDRYGLVIDPAAGMVHRWRGEEGELWFRFDETLLWSLLDCRVTDWVNELFLSCRFEASRRGPCNESVFSFFKCLSPRRVAYLEASLSPTTRRDDGSGAVPGELWLCGSYLVQRHCPHLGPTCRAAANCGTAC